MRSVRPKGGRSRVSGAACPVVDIDPAPKLIMVGERRKARSRWLAVRAADHEVSVEANVAGARMREPSSLAAARRWRMAAAERSPVGELGERVVRGPLRQRVPVPAASVATVAQV